MNNLEPIKRIIHDIRGLRVMLDSDLADLYNVETKNLKRTVRANMERFPEDFMFELTKDEYDSLRCKYFTLKNGRGQHSKYLGKHIMQRFCSAQSLPFDDLTITFVCK